MASTELKRTISSAGSQTKWGASAWVKRCDLGLSAGIYCSSKSDTTQNNRGIFFNSSDQIECAFYNGGYTYQVVTNRKFRDTNAWYHVVVNLDTSQSTAADRIKIWVNGVQETSMATSNYPSQNSTHNFLGTDITQLVGSLREGSSIHHSCIISHLHFTDGYCYPASTFGSIDSTTGEWKITTSPSGVTYGTNGFFILKDGNSVTDQSGQSNNLTVSAGTLTKTEDNPSNVFATFNPISGSGTMAGNATFSNGNNTVLCAGSVYNPFGSTIGVNKGKYYAEFKTLNEPGDGMIGIFAKLGASGNYIGSQTHQYSWYRSSGNTGRIRNNSNDIVTGIGGYTTNDIIGIALDCDNNKLYMHKNGTYISNGSGTGDPTNGNYGISITDPDDTDLGFYFMTAMDWGGSGRGNWSANFGNGYFGTTAVATNSGNGYQDVDGNGIFNYTVPTNYRALCTKGLNQ